MSNIFNLGMNDNLPILGSQSPCVEPKGIELVICTLCSLNARLNNCRGIVEEMVAFVALAAGVIFRTALAAGGTAGK